MGVLPPLRKLQYVIAVARDLHFRKAAERLHVSQPAISRQIREFEKDVGFVILQRDHHFVSLTKAGHSFVSDVDGILTRLENDFKNAVRRARAISREAPSESQYVVAHSPFASMQIRRIAMDLQREVFRDPPLRLRILPTTELLNAIDGDVIQAGITYAPVDYSGITSIPIGSDHWVAVVPAGKWSTKQTAQIREFSREMVISNGADRTHPALFRELELECAAKGFPLRTIAEVTSPNEAFDLVERYAGIVLLPAGVCSGLPPGVRAIRIEDLAPLQTVLVFRSSSSEFAHIFAEKIRAASSLNDELLRSAQGDSSKTIVLKKPPVATSKSGPKEERKRSLG